MTYNYLSAECTENIKLKRQVFACGIRNPGKFGLMESGIPLNIGIQNPSSIDKDHAIPEPGIHNSQLGIQNPRLS